MKHPEFPHLMAVPILEGAICVGLDVTDKNKHHLVFISPRHGEVQVYVSASKGGDLLFSYKVWDDATDQVYVREGPAGDPLSPKDRWVEEPQDQ